MAAMTTVDEPGRATLLGFLQAQRSSVLAIVAGLDEAAMRTAVVPSGWTPVGLIGHLGFAERHWFQQVATGSAAEVDWPPEDPEAESEGFTTGRPVDEVLDFYRDQCALSDAVLAATPLSAAPKGTVNADLAEEIHDLGGIVLHMIEETARHAGHLDIARELLDGRTGLGPR